jgi:hypothetical protein
LILINYGSIPKWSNYLRYQNIFYKYGFAQMRMPLFHLWNILALIYLIGLLLSIKNYFTSKKSLQNQAIFFLSILGIGIFSYYQGRSHDYSFLAITYPSIILLAIYLDKILQILRTRKLLLLEGLCAVLIFLFLFSGMLLCFSNPTTSMLFENSKRGILQIKSANTISPILQGQIEFIDKHSKTDTDILILASPPIEAILYSYTGKKNAAKIPGGHEIFLQADYDKKLSFIKNNGTYKIFQVGPLSDRSIIKLLDQNYQIVESLAPYDIKLLENKR